MCIGVVGVIVGYGFIQGVMMIDEVLGISVLMVIVIVDVVVVWCDYFDEMGGCYVYVLVDGDIYIFGELVKVIVCGVDVVVLGILLVELVEVFGEGWFWLVVVVYLLLLWGVLLQIVVGEWLLLVWVLGGLLDDLFGGLNLVGGLC